MPFVTKNPSYYFSALEEESTEPLHVGLYLAGTINEDRARDLVTLGKALRSTPRSIRCLWLRFKAGDESLLAAFSAFGEELVGATAVQSLVFEGRAGTAEVECLSGYFADNDLRGIQFRRSDVDMTTFDMLRPFLRDTNSLKVIDVSSNSEVGDGCVNIVLDALLEGRTRIETLNIGENNLDGAPDGVNRVSGMAVASIASFIRKTPSLSSITLRLRHLDDIGLGEIANVVKRKDCNVRRLDLSGNFGNSGIKIFAEALNTNISLKTVSFGCLKELNDVGGQVLLDVVDPFSKPQTTSSEWDHIKRSNHTLHSIYILDRPTVTMNKAMITKLQSISTLDPHRTLQSKCWKHIEKNIEGISHTGVKSKHMPEVLAFVHQHGTMDDLFRLIQSRNTPDLFDNPSPEKARLSHQMEQIERENEMLRELLESERDTKSECHSEDLHEENKYLRHLFRNKEGAKKCCLLPFVKLQEMWNLFINLLREPTLS